MLEITGAIFDCCVGKQLPNDSCILDHNLKDGDKIDIVIRMDPDRLLHEDVEYASFVQAISPKDGETGVPVDVQITIHFGPSPYGLCVYTPALSDYETLLTAFPHTGDMMTSLENNLQEATRRGYRPPWTEFKFHNRLLLLEIPEDDEGSVRERWHYSIL
jgi:hypothetical protein